jgi:hypothetical protein
VTARKIRAIEVPVIIEEPSRVVSPAQGGNAIFAAWRFLYQVLGARKERFELNDDGITVVGLTLPDSYNMEEVINDVYRRGDEIINPKLALFPGYYFLNGFDPLPYTNPNEMTADLTKIFHGANGNKSPQYAKDGIANYKALQGFAARRGRPPKTIAAITIGELNEAALGDVDSTEIEALKETLVSMA